MMDNNTTTVITVVQPPPPFPAPPRSIDLSPLEFILALIAVITIPALVYAFYFALPCPPYSSRRRHRSSDDVSSAANHANPEAASGLKYQKEAHVKEIGSDCPVCLSAFADGEEVKQLSACKHSFHASCIDLWLNCHANCPICRATVAVKRPTRPRNLPSGREDDLQQGLPDASALV